MGRAVLEDTHAPEGFRIEPFTVPRARFCHDCSFANAAFYATASSAGDSFCHIAKLTTGSIGLFRESRYAVEHAYGPWLAEGDWWNQTLWGFEQWDLVARAQDDSLLCCCIMRDLMQNEWQMAALYD